ncbi:hypothetical protein JM658_00345 [Joostella atrarenae]|uniref:Uncharacterized protein n=1 Tax=Joostella atrarenae TaxID=679257 RepID=A0ABS9IYV6_9FLAO|nr:hypothetical protein [Joostella atrarenae]MCF8713265.1 hypothetical protein [Joostella atrarenae]
MNKKDYLKDITEIKDMMNRSSRFISLSGLSGIFAGLYAIIGAFIGYYFLFPAPGEKLYVYSKNFNWLIILLAAIAILSFVTALLLTTRKAKKNDEKIWDPTTRRLLINFLIPLVTGGIYILIKLNSQHYGLTASLMLIFYGLALVNASKYTVGNIKYLGYAEIIAGLLCAALPGYGLWFWIIGFGFFHIIYGSIMFVEEKKNRIGNNR